MPEVPTNESQAPSSSRRTAFQRIIGAVTSPFKHQPQELTSSAILQSSDGKQHTLTRREFIKKAGVVGLALVAGGLTKDTEKAGPLPPRDLPKDILTGEELRETHIRIYQAPETKLYLRKNVFEFPLFKDSAEGRKLTEAVIVLVDNPTVSWNASESFPQDAQLVWRLVNKNPVESWREGYSKQYFQKKAALESRLERLEGSADFDLMMVKIGGLTVDAMRSTQERIEKNRQQQKELSAKLAELLLKEKTLGEEEPPDKVKGEMRNNNLLGQCLNTEKLTQDHPDFFKAHPELKNKVFIYLAVGGEKEPQPSESYPHPQKLEEAKIPEEIRKEWIETFGQYGWREEQLYRFDADKVTSGFILRHEIFHYKEGSEIASESEADTAAFNSLVIAWEKFRKTGDSSSYPFVFATKKGITITERHSNKETTVAA